MLTVGVYSVFTFLSGLASSYEMLLVFRVFQGIGFGGEWAVGAILVAELIRPEARGQALGIIQSAWAVGWALAVDRLHDRVLAGQRRAGLARS